MHMFLVILFALLGSAVHAFNETSVLVKLGQTIHIGCTVIDEGYVTWLFSHYGRYLSIILQTDDSLYYTYTNISNLHILQIKDFDDSQVGDYTCVEHNGKQHSKLYIRIHPVTRIATTSVLTSARPTTAVDVARVNVSALVLGSLLGILIFILLTLYIKTHLCQKK